MNATAQQIFPRQAALNSAIERIRSHLLDALEGECVTVNFYRALRLLMSHHSGPRLDYKEAFQLVLLFSEVKRTKTEISIFDEENRAFDSCNTRLDAAGTAITDLIWYWSATAEQRNKMRTEHNFDDQLKHATLALNDFHNMVLLGELNGRRPARKATNPAGRETEPKPDYFAEGINAGLRISLMSEIYS